MVFSLPSLLGTRSSQRPSPRNFDYVRRLGASEVFNYKSRTAVKDVIEALKGKTLAGALAIGAGPPMPVWISSTRVKGTSSFPWLVRQ